MKPIDLHPLALATRDAGSRNQVLGAFRALSDMTGGNYNPEECFLLPEGETDPFALKESFFYTQFPDYESFRNKFFAMADAYFKKTKVTPRVFVTAYNPTESSQATLNADMICRVVQDYYGERKLGSIFTAVLTSPLHSYKYVDLINVPKHLLTLRSRIRLLRHKGLRKRILITVGTINNFERRRVNEGHEQLLKKFAELEGNPLLTEQLAKFRAHQETTKKVVICLGGRVEGPEINFDVNYAQKLFADAETLARVGYGVVIVNGPRTPNDVTDYLWEKASEHPTIIFQNSKKIAETAEEREPSKWRIYSGKHEETFRNLSVIGNVYPAVLGYKNTLVVHTMDTYACCETTNAAIPTAISSQGLFVSPSLRYDCHNLQRLLCPKYAIDWDEFVTMTTHMHIEPDDLSPQVLSSPLRVFAETVVNRINRVKRRMRRKAKKA